MNFQNEYDLENFVRLSLDLISIQRLDGTVLQVNPSFERILGWTEQDLLGKNPFDLLHPEDLESTLKEISKLNEGIPTISFQNRYRCADGKYKHFEWSSFPDLKAGLLYTSGRDITDLVESNKKISQLAQELKEANDRLFEQASTDPLTKLKNRRAFNEELNYLIHKLQKEKGRLSVLMLDADHFKAYNDQFGHPAGDQVLVQLASILLETFRENDILSRFGGEEFIVALPDTSREQSIEVAESLLTAVRKFQWDKRPITVSLGITTFFFDSISVEKNLDLFNRMIENADRALYESKLRGRDALTHFSDLK
ncbi:GGDEF domain-containing protein [Leptospira sp. 201903070]|uniref:diguanylate cyclase n=1 Tax=Leptospira ainlahdjerensis TaxID=2810033 RepID=A0ABS2UBU2_9LEPT|nr:sensor domain-containing diguanylate cyclase [Leptospira ainlahdjerensis]MBM9577013.1 GGDEF domain-containing protein [Leptospira ainlahdjerensis]